MERISCSPTPSGSAAAPFSDRLHPVVRPPAAELELFRTASPLTDLPDSIELEGGELLARLQHWLQALRGIPNNNEWTPGLQALPDRPQLSDSAAGSQTATTSPDLLPRSGCWTTKEKNEKSAAFHAAANGPEPTGWATALPIWTASSRCAVSIWLQRGGRRATRATHPTRRDPGGSRGEFARLPEWPQGSSGPSSKECFRNAFELRCCGRWSVLPYSSLVLFLGLRVIRGVRSLSNGDDSTRSTKLSQRRRL
jgi:hypothetical protein